MSSEDISVPRVQPTHLDASRAQQAAAMRAARGMLIAQVESKEGFQMWIDEGVFNPIVMSRKFESLENKRKRAAKEEAEKADHKEQIVQQVQRAEEISEQFSRKNPEFQARSLLLLLTRIAQNDTKEEILRKVLEMYPDHSLADEALDFLLRATEGNLAKEVRRAKEDLNAQFGREVKAGKNISEQAREFSKLGLGSPMGLRNLYREVTGNPRDANTLFNELTTKFNYDRMKTVVDFLLHSMGSDLKAKGPSIDRGELYRLLTESRKLQGILGVFRFFKSRMNLILAAFERQGLQVPMRLGFEALAKQFMKALQERYPSADKILQLGAQLGISEELLAQVIVYTQMRDAIRQTAPRLFRSDQHRQDMLNAFIDAIEDLDEQLEEEDEEEDKEDDD